MQTDTSYTVFAGDRRLAQGSQLHVALAMKLAMAQSARHGAILAFDDHDGAAVDFDLRGSDAEVAARIAAAAARADVAMDETPPADAPRGPGRPRLGVVAREITLLPRHWDWLATQPGGASVTLRRLVDGARAGSAARDRQRQAQAAADRFMLAMAGNRPGYEDAARALYAGDGARFAALVADWPMDIRAYIERLAQGAFASDAAPVG